MNLRIISTITLSIAFAVLLITGVLLYATPYNYFVGSLHIWGAVLFLACIAIHIKNNAKVYKNHMQKRSGKWAMGLAISGIIPLVIGLTFNLPPISSVATFGYNLKKSAEPDKREYTVINLSADADAPKLNLFFKAGREYHSAPQSLFLNITYTSTPQIVVWMETLEGKYIDTLYITGKTSDSSYRSKDPAVDLVRRPEALPYWSHKRGIKSVDGLYTPDQHNSDLDGIAAATPKVDYQVSMSAPKMGRYKLMIEVNRTYDFNEYYNKTRFPDDAIYSGSGSSGQPSLIYETIIDSNQPGQHLFQLVGHGHHSGKDGSLYTDLSNITTAKQILDFIVANIE
jgi:Domain of unknown function (DUF4405)